MLPDFAKWVEAYGKRNLRFVDADHADVDLCYPEDGLSEKLWLEPRDGTDRILLDKETAVWLISVLTNFVAGKDLA